jgi:putative flippase GtrA
MAKRKITHQMSLFLIITFFFTIFCYLLFVFLVKFLSIHYLFAVIISYLFGIITSFPFYEKHTFHSKEKLEKSIIIYGLINLLALIFNLSLLYFIVELFRTNIILTYLFVLATITFIKFIGFKILAFNNKEW